MEWWKRNDKTVGSFEANGYRLYAIISNIWEWCLDAYDEEESRGKSIGGRYRY